MLKIIGNVAASTSFLAMVLLVSAPRVWGLTTAGAVSAVNGSVSIERAGRSVPAVDGTPVQVGDKFTTGPNSRITIKLSDGSQLELNDSSALVLTEDNLNPDGSRASTKVTLLTGLVRSLVHFSPSGTPNFEVHTPNAVASARGTLFEVSYQTTVPPAGTP
jgi:hypothetical protein